MVRRGAQAMYNQFDKRGATVIPLERNVGGARGAAVTPLGGDVGGAQAKVPASKQQKTVQILHKQCSTPMANQADVCAYSASYRS